MGAFPSGKNSEGFTLLEVLIAITVLTVGLMGMFAMTLGSIRGQSFSGNLTKATTLARERIEQIKNADYATVTTGNYPPEDYDTMAGFEQFQRTVGIADNTPVANTKTITVTVSWNEHEGVTRNVTLNTVIVQ